MGGQILTLHSSCEEEAKSGGLEGDKKARIWHDMLTRRGRESGSQVVEIHMGHKSKALG